MLPKSNMTFKAGSFYSDRLPDTTWRVINKKLCNKQETDYFGSFFASIWRIYVLE